MKGMKLVLLALLAPTIVALSASATLRSQSRAEDTAKAHQRVKDEDQQNVPVTDFPNQNAAESDPLRKIRDGKQSLKDKPARDDVARRLTLKDTDPKTSFTGVSDHEPDAEPLPVNQSDAVIIGKVIDSHAHLSTDKTSIYSEFIFNVEDVLKRDGDGTLKPGITITTMRPGGGVRFPSGVVIKRGVAGKVMPQTGRRYLLFLKYDSEAQYFPIVTGYELSAGKVLPLDGIPQWGSQEHPFASYDKYRGVSEPAFLNEVKTQVAYPHESVKYWDGTKWRVKQ
jgi:hypothetical protein